MKKLVGFLGALLVGAMLAGPAAAVTYDFSTMGIAEGTSFEGATLGVATLTSQDRSLIYTSGYGGGLAAGLNYGATSDTYIKFSQAVSNVMFRAGDGAGDSDAFAVSLYEFGTDRFLGTWNSPVFGGSNEPEWYTMTIAESNIGRLVFDPANSGTLPGQLNGGGGVIITDFGYDQQAVPEPSTIVLMGAGLVGAAFLRRKKKA